ncbi:hypothetical protein CEG14_19465 [Bordetella genomosp. 1]|uniref:Uncharacterized protein n=1 Tax=Bordetella genomosp. 1 TaxID=1395607 RepID=A0A261S6R1_9BORD|nr:hypothetical protein [Bordetella genomosp. 1]MDQ8032521.1 hypothetical protein [Bordetella sp.]OZI33039.1 hypothetical protein CEG14_19465 [Bordetella genomosp. 1]OZI57142.1 hypothetical protein CAL27_23130 [Bordetella genomosp. 1]
MANKVEPLITPDEVQEILAAPKETVKAIAWSGRPVGGPAQWMEFSCACKVAGEVREDVTFRVIFRAARTDVYGQAAVMVAEAFSASLFVGPHRVLGVDTDDSFHTSVVGSHLPHFRKPLTERSHRHVWVEEGEGYAEPVTPALDTIGALMEDFLPRANLTLTGGFAHPYKGRQIELIL